MFLSSLCLFDARLNVTELIYNMSKQNTTHMCTTEINLVSINTDVYVLKRFHQHVTLARYVKCCPHVEVMSKGLTSLWSMTQSVQQVISSSCPERKTWTKCHFAPFLGGKNTQTISSLVSCLVSGGKKRTFVFKIFIYWQHFVPFEVFMCVRTVAMSCSPAAQSFSTHLRGRLSLRPFVKTVWPNTLKHGDL